MTSVYFITILLVSVAVSSAAPSTRNDETFVGCMSKCLIGGDEQDRVTAVYKICKDSATCWGEHLGDRVQKCASGCKDPAPEELLVWTAIESSSLVVSDVPEFVKCMAKCMGKSLEQVEEWYKECKKNAKCWMKKVGLQGLKCAGKCLKADETTALLATETIESSSLVVSDVPEFVKCMAKCMGKSLEQVEEWYKECKKNAKCWMKKVGLRGLKCAGKCLKADETTALLATETIESSSLVVSDVPEFVKCMAKCMGKSLEQVEEWYKECKKNAKCWMKKVGLRGLKCAGKCLKADETTALLATESLVEPEDNSGFILCMAKCLGQTITEIKAWYKECKKKVKCWVKKVGKKALKCVGKCILSETNMTQEMAVTPAVETAIEKPDKEEVIGFLVCMAVCIGKDYNEIKQWYNECKKSVTCWVKKAGWQAVKCVGKCLLLLDEKTATSTIETGNNVTVQSNFTKCLLKCFMSDLMTIVGWYKKCSEDIDCWLKEAWEEGMKCAAKCGGNEAVSLPNKELPAAVNNDFVNCMARCLGKDVSIILNWFNKCHTDVKCWLKEVGFEGLKCAGKCVAEEKDNANSALDDPPVLQSYSPAEAIEKPDKEEVIGFLVCMAVCIGKDYNEIKQWYNECKKSVTCWVKKAGWKAVKCVGKCFLLDEKTATSTIETGPVNNNFLKCMAECLKKDISEILAWYNKCHTNIGCWLKEAGSEGLKCAGHCLFAREDEEDIRTTLELTPVNNDFVNCMAHCLGKDVSVILNWFNKCHTDVKCWLKEVGFEGLKCAGQCVGEEDTKSKIAPIPSQSDLVKFASYEKIIQIVKDSKSPLSSRRL